MNAVDSLCFLIWEIGVEIVQFSSVIAFVIYFTANNRRVFNHVYGIAFVNAVANFRSRSV